jgi:hypothetical protein
MSRETETKRGETVAPSQICCTRVMIGKSVGHIMCGGPVYTIKGEDDPRSFTFEWHPMWGPSRCSSTSGEILSNPFFPERSKFWPLFDRWTRGGKRVDEFGRCILAPAPIPCEKCAGVGYYKVPRDRKKYLCEVCAGDRVVHLKPLVSLPVSGRNDADGDA